MGNEIDAYIDQHLSKYLWGYRKGGEYGCQSALIHTGGVLHFCTDRYKKSAHSYWLEWTSKKIVKWKKITLHMTQLLTYAQKVEAQEIYCSADARRTSGDLRM